MGISYSDVMGMPTYERRFFIETLRNDVKQQNENIEEAKNNVTSSGKGSRSKQISGDALKSKMQSGEIPNQ
jgi:hypothetical protein